MLFIVVHIIYILSIVHIHNISHTYVLYFKKNSRIVAVLSSTHHTTLNFGSWFDVPGCFPERNERKLNDIKK